MSNYVPPAGLEQWFLEGERGLSSDSIVEVLEGYPRGALTRRLGIKHPLDESDFERCVKLLDAVSGYRARLFLMRDVSNVWSTLVDNWDELEKLLRDGHKSQLYERLVEIREESHE